MNHSKLVETLEHDLPELFRRDICYDIYSSDIFLRDPVNEFKGKFNYRIIFWTLRFHGQLFFSSLFFDVHNMEVSEDKIIVNWTVRGTLRVPWQAQIYFDGFSTYKVNESGLIYEHIDTWDRPPIEILKQFFRKGTPAPREHLKFALKIMTRD